MNDTTHTHGASCTCPPCMERSDQASACGILHAHTFELGDNGGCAEPADFRCDFCGVAMCGWHAWTSDGGRMQCAVCYGVQGYERIQQQPSAPTFTSEPPAWQYQPPTCGRCQVRMRYPRPGAGDGWSWGVAGWKHDCSFHR